ncbi:hypothetical protein F5146DRAFT_1005415 [Armillaria mellea]|nr:hypothetical protein F5146DRAFT_1005415 [Armillaria mellea]
MSRSQMMSHSQTQMQMQITARKRTQARKCKTQNSTCPYYMALLGDLGPSVENRFAADYLCYNWNWFSAMKIMETLSVVYYSTDDISQIGVSAPQVDCIISALIESSAIYTLALVVYLVLLRGNTMSAAYSDIVATYVRAIALTLLVLRVAARSTPPGSHCKTNATESV